MATIGDAMVTLLTDNWAGAGAPPTFGHLIDYQKDLAVTTEQVLVRLPVYDDDDPINDNFSNTKITLTIRVKTSVSDDRLKVLVDEVRRIVNTYAITGITRQKTKGGENTSDRKRQVFSYDVRAICETHMTSGGTAYSSPGAGDVDFPAKVTNKVDDKGFYTGAGDDVRIYHDGTNSYIDNETGELRIRQQAASDSIFSIKESFIIRDTDDAGAALFDLDSAGRTCKIGSAADPLEPTFNDLNILDALMLGSANAAYVPMILEGGEQHSEYSVDTGYVRTVGANNYSLTYGLPTPTVKGSLKLYITNLKFGVFAADANDFIGVVTIYGMNGKDRTQVDTDGTDHTSAGDKTFSGAVMPASAIDVSSYQSIYINVGIVGNAQDQGMWTNFRMECYYAA